MVVPISLVCLKVHIMWIHTNRIHNEDSHKIGHMDMWILDYLAVHIIQRVSDLL